MIQIFYRASSAETASALQQCGELFKGKENLAYYEVMEFLVKLNFPMNGDQLKNLKSIFQPEVKEDWDYNIGGPRDRENKNSRVRNTDPNHGEGSGQKGAPQQYSPQSWRMQGGRGRNENKEPVGISDSKFESMVDHFNSDQVNFNMNTPPRGGPETKQGNTRDEMSTSRLMNLNVKEQNAATEGQPSSTIYPEYANMSPGGKGSFDSDLNLLLRRRMSALIGK